MTASLANTPIPILPAYGASFDTHILAGTRSPNTIDQYRMHFAAYCNYAGDFTIACQPPTLARWRQHLFAVGYYDAQGESRPYTVAAINQRLAAVRSVMLEAAQQGYIEYETAEAFRQVKGLALKANKDRQKVYGKTAISRGDMQHIVEAPDTATLAGKMHCALLLTLATTGARITEIVTLTPGQLQWGCDDEGKTGWQVWIAGKNKVEPEPRALGAKAKDAIDAWLAARMAAGIEADFIFTGFAGRGDSRVTQKPISRQAAWQIVQRYADGLGLSHIKPHDFRRYVGTQLARRDIRIAQKQLGHASIATTAKHYVLDTVHLGITDDLV